MTVTGRTHDVQKLHIRPTSNQTKVTYATVDENPNPTLGTLKNGYVELGLNGALASPKASTPPREKGRRQDVTPPTFHRAFQFLLETPCISVDFF